MSYKNRIKFVVTGVHPLLPLVRDRLIETGYALVPWSERPDFCLFGAKPLNKRAKLSYDSFLSLMYQAKAITEANIPVCILSTGDVYQSEFPCVENNLKINWSKNPLISSPILYTLLAEQLLSSNAARLTLRVFNVYGSGINRGVVRKFFKLAKRQKPLPIHGSGYQLCTFLHQDDFLTCIDSCVSRFTSKHTKFTGTYNIGHTETSNIKRLSESVWQLVNKDVDLLNVQVPYYDKIYSAIPDITRIQHALGWEPTITLRQGLWRMVQQC